MKKVPDQNRLTVYRVDYRYRIKRKSPGERWKKRYKWRHDSRLVRCASKTDVLQELTDYIKIRFTKNEYDLKIVMISEVKL